jgi:hypothetical protein
VKESERDLRHELAVNLDGGNAHMTFDEVIGDFPLELINVKAPSVPYGPWHFIEHMRIAQWDILQFIINPGHVSPDYPYGYRPGAHKTADEKSWRHSINAFKKDLRTLREMALDDSIDLFGPIPHAPGYTIYKELLTVSAHNSYHIGEFAMLRQVLNAWPEYRPYLTG